MHMQIILCIYETCTYMHFAVVYFMIPGGAFNPGQDYASRMGIVCLGGIQRMSETITSN